MLESLEYFCFSLCVKYIFQNRTFHTALEGPPVRHHQGTGDVWAGDRLSPFLTVSVIVSSEPLAGKVKPKFLWGCFKPAPPSFSGQDSVEGDSVLSLKKSLLFILGHMQNAEKFRVQRHQVAKRKLEKSCGDVATPDSTHCVEMWLVRNH